MFQSAMDALLAAGGDPSAIPIEKVIQSPVVDRLVLAVLLLVIAVMQILRVRRPARVEIDMKPLIGELERIAGRQVEFFEGFQQVQARQTEMMVQALERQLGARQALDNVSRSLEEHRRKTEGEGRRRST